MAVEPVAMITATWTLTRVILPRGSWLWAPWHFMHQQPTVARPVKDGEGGGQLSGGDAGQRGA